MLSHLGPLLPRLRSRSGALRPGQIGERDALPAQNHVVPVVPAERRGPSHLEAQPYALRSRVVVTPVTYSEDQRRKAGNRHESATLRRTRGGSPPVMAAAVRSARVLPASVPYAHDLDVMLLAMLFPVVVVVVERAATVVTEAHDISGARGHGGPLISKVPLKGRLLRELQALTPRGAPGRGRAPGMPGSARRHRSGSAGRSRREPDSFICPSEPHRRPRSNTRSLTSLTPARCAIPGTARSPHQRCGRVKGRRGVISKPGPAEVMQTEK